MQKKTGDIYIAGLWTSTLPFALLWSPANSSPMPGTAWNPRKTGPARRTSSFCAPTWSWASLHLQTDYVGKWFELKSVFHDAASIVGMHCQFDGLTPFGRIKAASLTIKSLLTKVYLTEFHFFDIPKFNRCKVGYEKCDKEHVHTVGCVDWDIAGLAVLDMAHPGIMATGVSQFWSLLVCRKQPPHPRVFLDYTGTSIFPEVQNFVDTCVISYYLLLEQKADRGNVFERIGLYLEKEPTASVHKGAEMREVILV
jgi:hypothetical protein